MTKPPAVDPWKAFRGICSGTLILEAIVVLLVLTVIARVDNGAEMVAWKIIYVLVLSGAMVAACAVQTKPYALVLDMVLALAAVAGYVVHPSMAIAGVIFLVVWLYLLYLRSTLQKRIEGGYLPSQHV